MKKYRILLVNNHWKANEPLTYLSALIRFVTGEYNHVAIHVEDTDEVIEAVGQGVICRTFQEWYDGGNRTVLPMLPPVEMTEAQYYKLKGLIGKRYGYFDLIRVGWHFLVTRKLGLKRKQPFNGKGYICSELATLLLGVEWFIVPNDLQYLKFLKKGKLFETRKPAN